MQTNACSVNTTVDQSYKTIVGYLERMIVETGSEEAQLRAILDEPQDMQVSGLTREERRQFEIDPTKLPGLKAAVEHIHAVLGRRKSWHQIVFSVKEGQWNMQVIRNPVF